MSATSVTEGTARSHRAGPGSIPRVALHDLIVRPIPAKTAKDLLVREHYHSMPGATKFAFGVFAGPRLAGALTLGAGRRTRIGSWQARQPGTA